MQKALQFPRDSPLIPDGNSSDSLQIPRSRGFLSIPRDYLEIPRGSLRRNGPHPPTPPLGKVLLNAALTASFRGSWQVTLALLAEESFHLLNYNYNSFF